MLLIPLVVLATVALITLTAIPRAAHARRSSKHHFERLIVAAPVVFALVSSSAVVLTRLLH